MEKYASRTHIRIHILLLTFLFLALVNLSFAASPGKLLEKKLPNGMKILVKENSSNKSITFNCLVKTGSIHEGDYLGMGLSHYLEHLVSGGSTSLRTEDEYSALTKKIGAYVNAYTTYGHTAYHITADRSKADDALAMITENLMLCSLYDKEIIREKDVILKEFVYRTTSPRDMISQRHMELVFRNSNLKYPIIGIEELFKKGSRDNLVDYYSSRYQPNNMIFVACGDFKAEEMLAKVEKSFEKFSPGKLFAPNLAEEPVITGNRRYVEEFDTKLPLGYITWVVPESDYREYFALDVAMEILFSKRNSPVRLKLIEETGLVTSLYGFLQDIDGVNGRLLRIIFDARKSSDMDRIISLLDQEVAKVLEKGITSEQVESAKARYKAYNYLKTPSSEDEADKIARNIYSYGIPDTFDLYMDEYERLTPQDCTKAMKKFFVPTNRVIFLAVPKGEARALRKADKTEVTSSVITRRELDKNFTLIHQFSDKAPLINGTISLKDLTIDHESSKTLGMVEFLLGMMLRGSKNFPSKALDNWTEDHMASFSVTVKRNEASFSFRCLKDDYPTMEKILVDAFTNPLFEKEEIDLALKRVDSAYKSSISDPAELHGEFRNSVLYKGKRDSASLRERNEILQKTTADQLKKMFKSLFKTQGLHISYYGDLTPAEAEKFAGNIRKAIPAGIPEAPIERIVIPKGPAEYDNPYKFEAVNVNLNYPAPDYGSPDFMPMLATWIILNGSNGRLHTATRIDRDLAYFAYSSYTHGNHSSFFRLISQTSLEKKDELRKTLAEAVARLAKGDLTSEEIQSAVDEWHSKIKSIYTDEKYFELLAGYDSKGLGCDFPDKAAIAMKKLTVKEISDAVSRWLKDPIVIISYPEKKKEEK
ncbi:MAG: hypothetical protein CVV64_07405 [Candidatus Wallbacteria bacterium HGW-Wallbacteria-1]|jgi:zinc protease|uniref:Insulinase family protein n=1 Tax=Candidatus Wallbacteria bacterium HGW-Wallbacteria-1 TaxID=2013854 RepID=A0A2N1PQU0_9BACT|nr:MAG: hypothetical protein CVV64_07405 [Candidatus Wallbacteria bacterium HGW-Wallbacteria-1]